MSVDVAEVLYSVINDIGKDKIRTELNSDITRSQEFCSRILASCKAKIGKDATNEVMASLCEALLHFMLTACQLPSQRKLQVRGVDIDLIIPSARALVQDPNDAIVIQVFKKDSDRQRISDTSGVQPRIENLWTVSASPMSTSHKNYNLETENSFSSIVVDIYGFVKTKGSSRLKLFHGD